MISSGKRIMLWKVTRLMLLQIPVVTLLSVSLLGAPIIINPQSHIVKRNWVNEANFSTELSNYTGNVDMVLFNAGIMGRYVNGDHLLLVVAEQAFGEKSDEKFRNKNMEHLRYLNQFSQNVALEVYGQHQFDEFRRLDIRALSGLGPRFSFLLTKEFEVAFGSSYFYEYNRYSEGDFRDSKDINLYNRWSNYLHLDLVLDESLSFNTTFYWQPRFDKFNDYRLFNSSSLEIKLKPFLTFFITASFIYDSKPPESVENTDSTITTGITLEWVGKKNRD